MLRGYAALLDWSIGDVEYKHAHRQSNVSRHATSGFSSVCGASISSDWKAFHTSAVKQLGPLPAHRSDDAEKITYYGSEHHAYLKDFSAERKLRHADLHETEISHSLWAELKPAFDSLAPERKSVYVRMSRDSKLHADTLKAEKKRKLQLRTNTAEKTIDATVTGKDGIRTYCMNLVTSAAAVNRINHEDQDMGSSLGLG